MRVELEKIKFGMLQVMDRTFMDSNIEVIQSRLCNALEFQITGFLFGEPQPDITIEYPKDWWQAFKERWFPKWLLNKYPVVKTYHTLRRNIVYPDLKISIPDQRHRLVIDYSTGHRFSEESPMK
jgi:hypothetical protein